jgi:spore coat-associated protein N
MRLPTSPSFAAASANAWGTKLLASLALVGAAAGIAGLGTYATFTSSTPAQPQSVTAGTVVINVGATGAETNRLNMAATDVAPGDTIQRTVDLDNTGSLNLASLSVTTTATTSSLLDTDATNGLQMTIDSCSVPWTETVSGSVYTYTCSGTTTSVLSSTPVIQASINLSSLNSMTAGGSDHLRVTLSLPSSAGNTFQGLNSVIDYTFTGTQRAGTSR